MSVVELIPINKGNQLTLDHTIITTIGRTPTIGCLDNKISRNHAQLFIKSDGTVWIKAIHHNPIFYRTKTDRIVTLTKDKEYQLYNNDQFGLLPDEYFYRVSIKSNEKEIEKTSQQDQTENSSTRPKSPVQDHETLTIENHDEEKSQSTDHVSSQTTRALPRWMSNDSLSTSKDEKELNREKTTATTLVRPRIYAEGKKPKALVYDDDDDEHITVASSTALASTSNTNNPTVNNQASSSSSTKIVALTKRERCPYGESCYRKNVLHREQASHPGDPDWEIKNTDTNQTKPDCPFGNECYRTNPEHLIEYRHPKKGCIEIKTKSRTSKRKADEEDDDDDGLPNEYDYNDSFIDDERLDSDTTNDGEEEMDESDDDTEWKPQTSSRYADENDDDASDESERELTTHEAADFIKGSVTKKPRIEEDDDED